MVGNKTITNKNTFNATLAAFFSNFLFGFSFWLTNVCLKYASPSVLLALRFFLAFVILNILVLFKVIKISFKGKNVWPLVLMGLLQPVIYFYCETYGMKFSSATFAAVVIALVPVGAMIYSALFMKEPPTFWQAVFGVISVIGVILLSISDGVGTTTVIGTLLLIGAVVCAVGFNAISHKSASQFSAFERTYIMFAVSSVVFTAFAVIENIGDMTMLYKPLSEVEFLGAILYLGVLSSIIAYTLINYANTYLPISRTTIFSNIITIVSIFVGIVILKDTKLSFENIFYSIMIIVGIFGVQKFAK